MQGKLAKNDGEVRRRNCSQKFGTEARISTVDEHGHQRNGGFFVC